MKLKEEWTKAYLIKPRDNIESHIHIKAPRFIPSYEKNACQTSMTWIIGWEYSRIWLKERDMYIIARVRKEKPKRIRNNYEQWIQKRKVKLKKNC